MRKQKPTCKDPTSAAKKVIAEQPAQGAVASTTAAQRARWMNRTIMITADILAMQRTVGNQVVQRHL
jgi:hypothetical protein